MPEAQRQDALPVLVERGRIKMTTEFDRRVKARQGREVHLCHWPGCTEKVPPKMWGCKPHWFRLPKYFRDRIWGTYVAGQEITKTPSPVYLAWASRVQDWIVKFGNTSPETQEKGRADA